MTKHTFIASLIGLLFLSFSAQDVKAQSYAFGLKLGPTLGIQQWNGSNSRQPLVRYHATAFIESAPVENTYGLFAQLGYHEVGSSVRTNSFVNPNTGNVFPSRNYPLGFRNVHASVGAKKKTLFRDRGYLYYGFGLRGEFNINMYSTGYLQGYEGFQNRFTYGILVNTGIEFPFGEFISGIVELSIGPDFSKQINIGPIDTGYNNSNGNPIIINSTEVTNIFVELSVGMRFLHKITYID